MKKINIKIYNFLLIFLMTYILIGCKQSDYEKNVIRPEEIFFQEDTEYYVYFYRDGCMYCDDLYELINDYIENPYEKNLYVCKIKDTDIIDREYANDMDIDGQGPNKQYFVDYITVYTSLWIAGTPSLIRIDEYKRSFYVTSGKNNIIEFFNNLLKSEDIN